MLPLLLDALVSSHGYDGVPSGAEDDGWFYEGPSAAGRDSETVQGWHGGHDAELQGELLRHAMEYYFFDQILQYKSCFHSTASGFFTLVF